MLRRSLTLSIVTVVSIGPIGCAPDIGDLEDLPPLDSVVEAQFDPTNIIPQLQLIPTPTALAQNPDGTINKDAVRPAPCELPNTTQCLEFVDGGWPATLFPVLFFSAPLVVDTLADGIKLYEVGQTGLTEVSVQFDQLARQPPPEACQSGNNGTDPAQTFDAGDVEAAWGPTPTDVVIRPASGALTPGTQYILVATRALRGSPNTEDGPAREVEPSGLFDLLNREEPSVFLDEATNQVVIDEPLLRSQVQDSVLQSVFPGRSFEELSPEEREIFDVAFQETATSLLGLNTFVSGAVGPLVQSQLAAREDIIIVNTWRTGDVARTPTEVLFDPLGTTFPEDIRVPLPTDQLNAISSTVTGSLQVNFPTEGLDPTLAGLVGGLNTLDGFGLTTPILLRTSRDIDQASLAGNVLVVELDAAGMPLGPPLGPDRVVAVATASSAAGPSQIAIQPLVPLKPSTSYAVGVTNRVLDTDGEPISAATTFEFMKLPSPIVDAQGTVAPALVPQLQCAPLQSTGALASDQEVQVSAAALEIQLGRARWQPAFQALEGLSPAVPRTEVAMAFTYTTQSITDTIDLISNALLEQRWEMLPPNAGRLAPAAVEVTGTASVAELIQVTDLFCISACEAGALEPQVPANACQANRAAVEASPLCQLFVDTFAGNIASARLHDMRGYEARVGPPFLSGTFTPASIETPTVVDLPIWVITPNGTPPANGWPVAIFQHGLGGAKENALFIANTLARAGWATVSMDLPYHGVRASDIANPAGIPCVQVDPANVTCGPDDTCTGGCDNIRDSSGTGFITVPNIFGNRDNYQQATIDHITLRRTIERESMAGRLLSDLDGTRIGYIGQSLGGITGANFAAYTSPTDLEAIVLNVAGGNLTTIVLNTIPGIAQGIFLGLAQAGVCDLVDPVNPGAGCEDTPLFRLFLLLQQWVQEPGDPKATSVGVVQQLPGRALPLGTDRVLMQISQPDPVVSNLASQELAASYGFDLVNGDDRYQVYDFSALPNANDGGGCHGFLLQPSCGACFEDTFCNTIGVQEQAAGFLDSRTVGDQRPMSVLGGLVDCSNPCGN